MSTTHLLTTRTPAGHLSYWSGSRWVEDRGGAKAWGTWGEADEARRWLESDGDVGILVVRGERRVSA